MLTSCTKTETVVYLTYEKSRLLRSLELNMTVSRVHHTMLQTYNMATQSGFPPCLTNISFMLCIFYEPCPISSINGIGFQSDVLYSVFF